MSLFDNEYEMNEELEELFEDDDELFEDDDELFEDDDFDSILESMDGNDEYDEESSYFFDEGLLEARGDALKGIRPLSNNPMAFDIKVRFHDNLKSLIAQRQQIAKKYAGKSSYGTKLKYLKARKDNGIAIIDTKIARYKTRLKGANEAASTAESIQESFMENLVEGFQKGYKPTEAQLGTRFQKGDKNKQQKKARDARYSDDAWKKGNMTSPKGRARKNRERAFGTLLSAIGDKTKVDKEILKARSSYYKSQMTSLGKLKKVFASYMDAYMAHVAEKIKARGGKVETDKDGNMKIALTDKQKANLKKGRDARKEKIASRKSYLFD